MGKSYHDIKRWNKKNAIRSVEIHDGWSKSSAEDPWAAFYAPNPTPSLLIEPDEQKDLKEVFLEYEEINTEIYMSQFFLFIIVEWFDKNSDPAPGAGQPYDINLNAYFGKSDPSGVLHVAPLWRMTIGNSAFDYSLPDFNEIYTWIKEIVPYHRFIDGVKFVNASVDFITEGEVLFTDMDPGYIYHPYSSKMFNEFGYEDLEEYQNAYFGQQATATSSFTNTWKRKMRRRMEGLCKSYDNIYLPQVSCTVKNVEVEGTLAIRKNITEDPSWSEQMWPFDPQIATAYFGNVGWFVPATFNFWGISIDLFKKHGCLVGSVSDTLIRDGTRRSFYTIENTPIILTYPQVAFGREDVYQFPISDIVISPQELHPKIRGVISNYANQFLTQPINSIAYFDGISFEVLTLNERKVSKAHIAPRNKAPRLYSDLMEYANDERNQILNKYITRAIAFYTLSTIMSAIFRWGGLANEALTRAVNSIQNQRYSQTHSSFL